MKEKCTVYIDEAGDLGIRRGTKWFVIAAAVVPKPEEPKIREAIKDVREQLGIREIHLRQIHDFMKTSYIISKIKDFHFTLFNVLMDTDAPSLRDSMKNYSFMCRILLERVSLFLEEGDMLADVVFSSRGTSRDGELVEYVKRELMDFSDGGAGFDRFSRIECKTASSWDMLQLADICATSMFRAYEKNKYGFTTPCHMSALKDRLYCRFGNVYKYGIKFYADGMEPGSEYFNGSRPCGMFKNEETPGATSTCQACW